MPQNIGPYELQDELGYSDLYVVYFARDTRTDQVVALKVPGAHFEGNAAARLQFISAGEEAAAYQHRNIVTVYDAGEIEGQPFIAMEYIHGMTLQHWLDQVSNTVAPSEAAEIVTQIAEGLDYVHLRGGLHGSINARNIFITEDGRAVLGDYGIFRASLAAGNGNYALAYPEVNDLAYCSPEQVRGDGALDARMDVYSLAVVAYRMLTGILPFNASDASAMLRAVSDELPIAPEVASPTLSPGLAYVLRSALAKQPSIRYGAAGEFADALRGGELWTRSSAASAVAAGGAVPAGKFKGRRSRTRRWSALILVLFLLAILAATAFLYGTRPDLRQRVFELAGGGAPTVTSEAVDVALVNGEQNTPDPSPTPMAGTTAPDSSSASTAGITATLAVDTAAVVTTTSPASTASITNTPETVTGTLDAGAVTATRQADASELDEDQSGPTETVIPTLTRGSESEEIQTPEATDDTTASQDADKPIDTPVATDERGGSEIDARDVLTAAAPLGTTRDLSDTELLSETLTAAFAQILIPTDTPDAGLETEKSSTTSAVALAQSPTASATGTDTPQPPTVTATTTRTSTPQPPTETATDLPTPTRTPTPRPTATSSATPTRTRTPIPPTATRTNTPAPTATPPPTLAPTATNTPVPPTMTRTNTPAPTATPPPTATALPTLTPTETETPLPPTATRTNTPAPTETPTTRPTSTPRPTLTPTKTETPVPPTATRTNTPAPTATSTRRPTSTPRPTLTPTKTETPVPPTATRPNTPAPTSTPLPTSTPAPTSTPLPTATPTPIPVNSSSLQLLLPDDGSSGRGSQAFEWRTTIRPPEGQAFELVFWPVGEDPMGRGFGLAEPTTNNRIVVDLDALDLRLGDLLQPGEYNWGLLLVQIEPYRRIQFLEQQRRFQFVRNSGSSGGDISPGD